MNKYSSRKFWAFIIATICLMLLAVFNESDVQMSIVAVYTAFVGSNVYQKKIEGDKE
jgi:hypothetical protein